MSKPVNALNPEKFRRANPLIERAQAVIAGKLGVSADAVSITTGDQQRRDVYISSSYSSDDLTNLFITVRVPSDLEPEAKKKQIREALGSLAPLTAIAQWKPEEKQVKELSDQLKAATSGTEFNTKLLEWPGFNPEIAKTGWGVSDYALSWVEENAYGVTFHLSIPTTKNTDFKPLVEKVSADINNRLPEIKESLLQRVEKYTKQNLKAAGKNDAEVQQALTKVREDMGKVVISVNAEGTNVKISLRSPEQAESFKTAPNDYKKPDNATALKTGNPLNQLTSVVTEKEPHPQLQKALARSFLFTRDHKPTEDFHLIAGRRDIKTAIAKELALVQKENPDREEAFKQILNSDVFKDHNLWVSEPGKPDAAPPEPTIVKDADQHDTIKIQVSLKEEQLKTAIRDLAAMGQSPVAAAAVPTAGANMFIKGIANSVINPGQTLETWLKWLKGQEAGKATSRDAGM
jgi:hypothetical protein